MLISTAHAQTDPTPTATTAETAVPSANGAPPVDTQGILIQNVAMIVLLVVMFYFLLIRPQQKRFKEHKEMVDSLKMGDKVFVGGLVGKISELTNKDEVVVDLGSTKVTALRSYLTTPTPEKVGGPSQTSSKKEDKKLITDQR